MTYAELAPAFRGQRSLQDEFLTGVGVVFRQNWSWDDTLRAHAAWHQHILRRRSQGGSKRPLADILIGSFALGFQGLLTRNLEDFQSAFPTLNLRVPQISSS